jgi:hypothetical protein
VCGRVVPEAVAITFAVVLDKAVATTTVTILPLKNVVQIHILITSVDLIKIAVSVFVVHLTSAATVLANTAYPNAQKSVFRTVSLVAGRPPEHSHSARGETQTLISDVFPARWA